MCERDFNKGGIYKTNQYDVEYGDAAGQKERMAMKGLAGGVPNFAQQPERLLGEGYRGYMGGNLRTPKVSIINDDKALEYKSKMTNNREGL